jgi:hypothetical protein
MGQFGGFAKLGSGSRQAANLVSSSALVSIAPYASSGVRPFIRQPRSVGTIMPDVTIEEHFVDVVSVTQHPIAQGTPVSDHAYRKPRQVTMKLGSTNANPVGGLGRRATYRGPTA